MGQVAYTEDAATNRTSYVYDEYGHQIEVIDALNQSTYTAYDLRGNVIRQYGATYPVWYEYDAEGRAAAEISRLWAALERSVKAIRGNGSATGAMHKQQAA